MLTDADSRSSGGEVKPLTVICVEDNADVLAVIKIALGADQSLDCTAAFESGSELLQLLESGEEPPNILITDWSMPGVSGDDLVRKVLDGWPDVRIIVYTAYWNRGIVDKACEVGAWGVVSKAATFDALLDAIHEVADGRMVIKC